MMRTFPAITLKIPGSRSRSHSKSQMHTAVSVITKACPVNDLDCFFFCQGDYRWSVSRGEGFLGGICYTL